MFTEKRLEAVHRIADIEDVDQQREAIRGLATPEDLLALAEYYNWDDGMEVPRAILDHPECELGLALQLFQLADGITWLTSDEDWEYQQDWASFCKELAGRLLAGHYSECKIPFDSELTKVQKLKAKKAGVADIFLTSIEPA